MFMQRLCHVAQPVNPARYLKSGPASLLSPARGVLAMPESCKQLCAPRSDRGRVQLKLKCSLSICMTVLVGDSMVFL